MIQQLTQVFMEEHTQRKEAMEITQEELKKFARVTRRGAALPIAEGDQLTRCATSEPRSREAIQEQTPVRNQGEEDCLDQRKREQERKRLTCLVPTGNAPRYVTRGRKFILIREEKGRMQGRKPTRHMMPLSQHNQRQSATPNKRVASQWM